MELQITDPAKKDMVGIYKYIALESYPEYAENTLDKLYATFELLLITPDMGTKRPEIGRGVQLYPVGKINVIYSIENGALYVLRVHHSALDSTSLSF